MKQYETVIGLEVHVELATKNNKNFLRMLHRIRRSTQQHITCPVCTGMPGSLPVLNKKVVEFAPESRSCSKLPDPSVLQI